MPTTSCASCGQCVQECTCPEPGTTADIYGRVWRHCEEGLSMTKASAGRFMYFCLVNHVEIGDVYAFNPDYKGCTVIASVRLRPDQFEAFERETGGKLRCPPRIGLN